MEDERFSRGQLPGADRMTTEEHVAQAWREIIVGAQSYRDDWIDEEGEYDEHDAGAILYCMDAILRKLREAHP